MHTHASLLEAHRKLPFCVDVDVDGDNNNNNNNADITRGAWLRDPACRINKAKPLHEQPRAMACARAADGDGGDGYVWAPHHCQIRYYNAADACAVMRRFGLVLFNGNR
jgi:hypothetical protein